MISKGIHSVRYLLHQTDSCGLVEGKILVDHALWQHDSKFLKLPDYVLIGEFI
jgi:hypothetical protein